MTNENIRLKRARKTRAKIAELNINRLTIHRSNTNIYAQIIDDVNGKTLLSASTMDKEFKTKLILEHPELGMKKGALKNLTAHSKGEQKRAGLDSLSDSEYNLLTKLNGDYMNKFKFPFIIAVSGLTKEEVLRNIKVRLKNNVEVEFSTAVEEIHKIAEIRLQS